MWHAISLPFPLQYQYTIKPHHETSEVYTYTASLSESEAPQYYYSYTWQYDWIHLKENIVAECQLDSGHTFKMTNRKLYLYNGKRRKRWHMRQIQQFDLQFKRLMFPLILGGVTAPLALVALISGFIGMWTGIAILIVGLLLMMYGYRGGYQFIVHFDGDALTLFIDERTPPVQHFVQAGNFFLKKMV